MDHLELKNTVFGEVFVEMLEARGLTVTPLGVGKLAEDAGLDGWKVINRMASGDARYSGPLDGLASALDLSKREMKDLAYAFAFEERRPPRRIPKILSEVNGCLGTAIECLEEMPPDGSFDREAIRKA